MIDKLKICKIGLAEICAPSRNNQTGMASNSEAEFFREINKLKIIFFGYHIIKPGDSGF